MGIDRDYVLTIDMYRQDEIDAEMSEKEIYQEAMKGQEDFNEVDEQGDETSEDEFINNAPARIEDTYYACRFASKREG